MAPLQMSSAAAPVSQERTPSTLLRAGVGREQLRYHPLSRSRQWDVVALGADSGDGRLGPSWGGGAPLGTSSVAAVGSRWSSLSSFAQDVFDRTSRPSGNLGRADIGEVDEPGRPHFDGPPTSRIFSCRGGSYCAVLLSTSA